VLAHSPGHLYLITGPFYREGLTILGSCEKHRAISQESYVQGVESSTAPEQWVRTTIGKAYLYFYSLAEDVGDEDRLVGIFLLSERIASINRGEMSVRQTEYW
jgi:hypothetical protein